MKNILVAYFSQTGQLKRVLDAILSGLNDHKDINIHWLPIEPEEEYRFPWQESFFDVFPDSVEEKGCKLKPLNFDKSIDYDLVIIGCQSWFLSPSIPVTAFLKHPDIISFLNNKKIVTVHGARNMCFGAQQSIKQFIINANAQLVGNVVLQDTHNNYISAITIIRWLVFGNKGPYKILPNAGISDKSIHESSKFGKIILEYLESTELYPLQENLVLNGAVDVKYPVLLTELNAKKIFRKFSKYVNNAEFDSVKWHKRIGVFKSYLLFALFGLSPLAMLVFSTIHLLFRFKTKKVIAYYQGIEM